MISGCRRRPRLAWVAVLAFAAAHPRAAAAQEDGRTVSVLVGGMAIERSTLGVVKVGYEGRHLALSLDVSRDAVAEERPGDAEDEYVLVAPGLAARWYLAPGGRSLYGEAGVGYARLSLRSSEGGEEDGGLPVAAWGIGGRWGQRPTGFFGEVGVRTVFPLREEHLYTTPEPPAGSRDETLSPGSWYLEPATPHSQLYVGVGFSF